MCQDSVTCQQHAGVSQGPVCQDSVTCQQHAGVSQGPVCQDSVTCQQHAAISPDVPATCWCISGTSVSGQCDVPATCRCISETGVSAQCDVMTHGGTSYTSNLPLTPAQPVLAPIRCGRVPGRPASAVASLKWRDWTVQSGFWSLCLPLLSARCQYTVTE